MNYWIKLTICYNKLNYIITILRYVLTIRSDQDLIHKSDMRLISRYVNNRGDRTVLQFESRKAKLDRFC